MPCSLMSMAKGTTVSIQIKYFYPYKRIRENFINPEKGHNLQNCILLREEVKNTSWKDQQVAEQVHVPQLHVHPKKSIVIWKRIPYNCLWFDAFVVPDEDRRMQEYAKSTATKRIFGLGENFRSTLAIDKTIVAHCQGVFYLALIKKRHY